MIKRVRLLAVSCKNGGLCPGGIDLDNPREWIRIVKNDGQAGAVQGWEIDYADPLDIIEFDGHKMPQGRQRENWVIDYNSCRVVTSAPKKPSEIIDVVRTAYNNYSYRGFWNNYRPFLTEDEFNAGKEPSESILQVSNIRIYQNDYGRAKTDFALTNEFIRGISMTDQSFYDKIKDREVNFERGFIVISIPKDCDWAVPATGEKRAYKFVSKIYGY